MGDMVYLDYNATAPMRQEVKDVMTKVWSYPGNASSVHRYGREAKALVEQARSTILHAACAIDQQLVFTSTGTEANNLILRGLKGYELFISSVEHASILHAANQATRIPVDKNGIVQLPALERLLKQRQGKKVLVSVMFANNETGALQPIKEIVEIAHQYGALVHTDAVQAFGKIPVNLSQLGIDACTISAHKIGGPVGVAALIFKASVPLKAYISGGGQEKNFRAGTENVPAICGFAKAATLAVTQIDYMEKVERLRDQLESDIKAICPEAVIDVGSRLPNTATIIMPGVSSETQVIHFDMENIAVSAGSACSSGRVNISHVLMAMGLDEMHASAAIRVSLGVDSKKEDIQAFVRAWRTLYERIKERDPVAA